MQSVVSVPDTLLRWFEGQGWNPFSFQTEAWQAYLEGRSGLIHAPTGLGKTYAVLGGPLIEAIDAPASPTKGQLKVLWITPLRALAGDTLDALKRPFTDLDLGWNLDLRHGDTTAYRRKKQREQSPHLLITTPESLSLLLSYEDAPQKFKHVDCIIVDEWHELLGTKRGVQVELAMARLRNWCPQLRIWGLSATLGNLAEAQSVLLGNTESEGVLIQGKANKKIEVETLLPEVAEKFPWAGHLGSKLADAVVDRIEQGKTTLVFTNTRSQSEIWYQTLLKKRPDWTDQIGLHHGSVDKEIRQEFEARLDSGEMRAVVCTSSLDLGVDFSPVDQVIQVGSPKGVARLMQRAGRSGHQPGAISRICGVPTNALEIVEFAAAREAIQRKEIESKRPLEMALDVLIQHVVTIALSKCTALDTLKSEVKATHAYRNLTDEEWEWVIDFASTGGKTLSAYPAYKKVAIENEQLSVQSAQIARFHRMSIGTITGHSEVVVKFERGRTLGHVEESFITKIKRGETFQFAGKCLKLVRFRNLVAQVKIAKQRTGATPTWQGGRSPLSSELAHAVSRSLRQDKLDCPELEKVAPILDIQKKYSTLPHDEHFLVEVTEVRKHTIITLFPFAGRLVHEGLAALFAYRLSQQHKLTLRTTVNDYGITLQANNQVSITAEMIQCILKTDTLLDDLLACMNAGELAKRQFREIARVSGLVIPGFPGQKKSTRQLQISSSLLYEVFEKYDPQNKLLLQAEREILERQLEYSRLKITLKRLNEVPLTLKFTKRLTPLAFPLWAEQLHSEISSESWLERVEKISAELEQKA